MATEARVSIPTSLTTKPTFTCKWCKHTFVREKSYMDHTCKQMQRAEDHQSPQGQAAWGFYEQWLRAKKRTSPSPQSFLDSKYYTTFMNFVKFCKDVQLVNPEKFISLAADRNYPPHMWTMDFIYVEYMEYLDKRVNPIDQVSASIKTMIKLSDTMDVDVSDIFDQIHPNDVIHLLRLRKLSPWFLLLSQRFNTFFNRISPEQRVLIETLIRPEYWAVKFSESQSDIIKIKNWLKDIDL